MKYGNRQSKPEKRIAEILSELGITHVQSFHLENKVYDFYLPQRKLLLEVDGTYWHAKDLEFNEMDETQRAVWRNDLKKVDIAHRNGYNLVRIWEDEITKEKVINCTRMFL